MNESSDEEPRPRFNFGFEETMEHLFIKEQGTIPNLLPYRTNKFKKIKEDYQALDPELQKIWHRLFIRVKDNRSPEEELNLEEILAFPIRKSDTMPACGRILKERQTIYRCFDCGLHLTSVMCQECFEEADHRGHRYEAMSSLGGTCDCGNLGSLKSQGFCKKHCGIVKIPEIEPKERERFLKINKKLYQWFLVLHIRDGYQALALLVNQILYLDKLNTDSLYYNRLTYEWLNSYVLNKKTNQEELIAESIFVMGPLHFDTNLDKWATELLLKLFYLDEAKLLLAQLYLKIYNTTLRFETSKFKDLFIQIFSTLHIIKTTMQKTKVSLDPKNRQDDYDIQEYYNQLFYIDCLDSESAREFYRPLIYNKGVDYAHMRYIHKNVDNGHYKIDDFYREKWTYQNGYYVVIKTLAKHFQDFPEDIAQQIRNEFNMCQNYQYKKNQAMIPHHRGAALFIFVYFKCDLTKIDPNALMNILKVDKETFLFVAKKILKRYLSCFRQFARSFGHREYDTYQFDSYLPLYISRHDGQKVFIFDCLGLKVFGTIFHKMKEPEQLKQVLFELYQEEEQKVANEAYWLNSDLNSIRNRMADEREMMKRHYKDRRRKDYPEPMREEEEEMDDYMEHQLMYRHMGMGGRHGSSQNSREFISQTQQKLARINVTYFAELIHFLLFLFQSVYIERPEVMIGNDCQIRSSVIDRLNRNQLIQILSNVQEISAEDMETVITFFFGAIKRETILDVANFNRERRVYTIKPEIQGTPICKDLLHSFIDNDAYIKHSTRGIMPNQTNKVLREIYLSEDILQLFLSKLVQNFKSITEKRVTLLKYLAGLIKVVGFAYGYNSDIFKRFHTELLQLAQRQNVQDQIKLVFEQSGSSSSKESSQAEQKRVEQLRKKQKEKLKEKTTTQTQNIKKILQANPTERVQACQEKQSCILCKGTQGLFYMGLYGESSLIFNIFREKGAYPFFQCCFHLIDLDCFAKIAGGKQQVSCPLCRSVCNILLPTESTFKNPQLMKNFYERLQVLSALKEQSKNATNLTAYLTKSFIPVFFVSLLQNKEVNSKKIDLYKIILKIIRDRYDGSSAQQKKIIEEALLNSSKEYQRVSSPFPLSHFITLVNSLVYQAIKRQQIDEKGLENLFQTSKKLAKSDIQKCINLATGLLEIKCKSKIMLSPVNNCKLLSEVISLYTPPQNIKELLQVRTQQEKKCKSGHNICACIICTWKGCADCSFAAIHAAEDHCNHSIFFSFVSGGLIYIANGSKFALPCLYLNEKTSEPWRPEKQDDFRLNRKSYDEMLGLLLQENVTEYVSKVVKQSDIHLLI